MHVKYLGHDLGKGDNAVDRYYSGSKAGNCDVFSYGLDFILDSMVDGEHQKEGIQITKPKHEITEAYNGPHNGQKYVGYNTERSEGSLRVFVPSEHSEC